MDTQLLDEEAQEIERHKYFLSESKGYDVGLKYAREDWLIHHAQDWREKRQQAILALQRVEIERHKWIESEKARRDLGRQAVMDWVNRYAAEWREWYDREGTAAPGRY